MYFIDHLFKSIRNSPFCYRFTLFTRVLLAAGFMPSGMTKLLGNRFTQISVDNPIGAFFEAMYQTGIYWNFLGLSQVIAAVLLLSPRTAHLGAAIFLPIMLNIFVITISIGFGGTPFVTGPMLLAVTYLCIWDFHRFRPMLTNSQLRLEVTHHRLDLWELAGFTIWALSLLMFFDAIRNATIADGRYAGAAVIVGVSAGFFTITRFVFLWQKQRFSFTPENGILATEQQHTA